MISYFLELNGSAQDSLSATQLDKIRNSCQILPDLSALDLFTPEASEDPFLDDGVGPLLVIQMRFANQEKLQQALSSTEFADLTKQLQALPVNNGKIYQEALHLEDFTPDSTPGAVSYLVNYQRPAADEQAFLAHYRAHHPTIMLRFPGLRILELGYPIDWQPAKSTSLIWANRMLFCEVSFDSVAALNAALASSVRQELRQDFATFPAFTGTVTHFAMTRHTTLSATS